MVNIFFQALILSGVLFWVGTKVWKSKFKRWGGVVLVLVFVFLVLVHRELELTRQLQGVLIGSLFILGFGWWDDWRNLSWRKQLLGQIFLVIVLLFFGFQIDYLNGIYDFGLRLDKIFLGGVSVLSAVFIFFWVIGSINAMNWLDGVDSSLGVVALFGGLSIGFVSLLPEVNQPAIAILVSIFLGTVVGFLLFNLPPAKVEAGTVGSYFVGFVLASLAIMAGSKIVTMMIVLILPLMDFGLVIFDRWRRGVSIFQKDHSHLHYRLRSLGWSDLKIFLIYGIFLGIVLMLYAWLPTREARFYLLLGEMVVVGGGIVIVSRKSIKSVKSKVKNKF